MYCILCITVYCLLYIVQMCKVCVLLFMYIVNVSYIVTCTAMAQSLVPKNFTISTLVYIMYDNNILFCIILFIATQFIIKQCVWV